MSKLPFEKFLEQALKRNKVKQAHPEVLARGIEMVRRCYDEGIYILFTDGLRTDIEQAKLFGQSRENYWYKGVNYGAPNKRWATNAEPGESFHNFGLALDYVLTDCTAKPVFWTRNKQWERAAAIAKELGFSWGGDWHSGIRDNPHIEYNGGLTINQVRAGLRPKFLPFVSTIKKGELTMNQYEELKKQIKELSTELKSLQTNKANVNSKQSVGVSHKDSWEWAIKEGIIRGDGSGNMNPAGVLTREQMATMIKRYHDKFIK